MKDQRECGGCYQPVRECECETEDERREREDRYREKARRAEEWPDSAAPLLGALVFFAVALLVFAIPTVANASPLCESAVHYEYRNTSTPRPKWAVSECRSVQKAARVFGVRESLAVAVAAHESDFKPWALSHAGAAGTMQVKPAYHCPVWMFGLKWCTTRGQWVRAGVRHLAELLDDFDEGTALRSYNAGRRGARLGRGERYMDAVRAAERRMGSLDP